MDKKCKDNKYCIAKPRLSVNGHLIRAIMNFRPGNKTKAVK